METIQAAIEQCQANCAQYHQGMMMAIYDMRYATLSKSLYQACEYRDGDENFPFFVCMVPVRVSA